MKRILVVKLADLGDLLTATPAIRALRYAHPDAHIGALITPKCASILAGTDLVDEIIPFEKAAFDSPLAAGGQLPVALGLGSGGESRVSMGIAVVGGMIFASGLTLFVIPVVYSYLSNEKKARVAQPNGDARELETA